MCVFFLVPCWSGWGSPEVYAQLFAGAALDLPSYAGQSGTSCGDPCCFYCLVREQSLCSRGITCERWFPVTPCRAAWCVPTMSVLVIYLLQEPIWDGLPCQYLLCGTMLVPSYTAVAWYMCTSVSCGTH